MFSLIPHETLVVQNLTIPHMKASILSYFEPEEQGCGINIGAPRPFPIKSILSRKSGPIEGAQYAYHENRLQQQNFPHLRISKPPSNKIQLVHFYLSELIQKIQFAFTDPVIGENTGHRNVICSYIWAGYPTLIENVCL